MYDSELLKQQAIACHLPWLSIRSKFESYLAAGAASCSNKISGLSNNMRYFAHGIIYINTTFTKHNKP